MREKLLSRAAGFREFSIGVEKKERIGSVLQQKLRGREQSFSELMSRGQSNHGSGDTGAIAMAAYSAGEALAAIGRATFPKPGWLAPGPAVTAPLLEGANPVPRFVELCLESVNLQRRMPADLRDGCRALVWCSG